MEFVPLFWDQRKESSSSGTSNVIACGNAWRLGGWGLLGEEKRGDVCTLSLKHSLSHSASQNKGSSQKALSFWASVPSQCWVSGALPLFSVWGILEVNMQIHHWFGGTSNSGLLKTPKFIATVYFSQSSNSCLVHSVQLCNCVHWKTFYFIVLEPCCFLFYPILSPLLFSFYLITFWKIL